MDPEFDEGNLLDESASIFTTLQLSDLDESQLLDDRSIKRIGNMASATSESMNETLNQFYTVLESGLFELQQGDFPRSSSGKFLFPVDQNGDEVVPVNRSGELIYPKGPKSYYFVPKSKDGRGILPVDHDGRPCFPTVGGEKVIAITQDFELVVPTTDDDEFSFPRHDVQFFRQLTAAMADKDLGRLIRSQKNTGLADCKDDPMGEESFMDTQDDRERSAPNVRQLYHQESSTSRLAMGSNGHQAAISNGHQAAIFNGHQSAGFDGRQSKGSDGRGSMGFSGRQSKGFDGRQSVGLDGRQSMGSDGRQSMSSDGRQSMGSDGRQSMGSDGRQSMGSDGRQSSKNCFPRFQGQRIAKNQHQRGGGVIGLSMNLASAIMQEQRRMFEAAVKSEASLQSDIDLGRRGKRHGGRPQKRGCYQCGDLSHKARDCTKDA